MASLINAVMNGPDWESTAISLNAFQLGDLLEDFDFSRPLRLPMVLPINPFPRKQGNSTG